MAHLGRGHGFTFPDNSAPTVSNLGTYWNGSTGAAHTGGDTRGFGSATLTMPIVTGKETTKVFYLSQQVFVPDHTADGVDAGKVVGVGIYAEREGYGLFSPGGQHGQPMALTTDVWHLVEARVTITTDGGLTDAFADDTGTMTVAYYLDGALFTSQTFNLADNSSFMRNGDIVLSWGDGLQRGWQGYVPEMYVTNMVFAEIVPVPEPATMTLLALGGLAILRRKR